MKINNAFSPVANTLNKTNNAPRSFTGAGSTVGKSKNFLLDFIEPLRHGDMSRNMFMLTAFTFLLGSRLIASRDKNEKRETLLRDLPTFVIAVQGVPFFEKIVANQLQKKTGFAILKDPNKYKDGLLNNNQLVDWYKYNPQLDSGFKAFSERLSNRGGNLKKIYSTLGEDVKNKLQKFSDNNKTFMEELSKDKELLKTVENEFKKPNNKAIEQAKYLRHVPKIAGFLLTLGLIGLFIPQFNIYLTRRINKNDAEAQNASKHKSKPENTSINA